MASSPSPLAGAHGSLTQNQDGPHVEDIASETRMQMLMAEQLQRPATINSIEIHGAKNTRRDFLDPVFSPLVAERNNVGTTLGDVMERLGDATRKLSRFDIFNEPVVRLSEATSNPHAAGTDLDVAIRLAEKSRFILKTGTDLGNAEGSAYGNLLCRNILGGAESLSLNASAGTRTRSAYSAALSAPVAGNPDIRVSLEGQTSATQRPWASHEEDVKGGTLRLAWLSKAGDRYSVSGSGAWRQLTGLSASASPSVRADAGDSVKNSVSYSFVRDRRDNPMLPQSGYLIKTASELAGWGPLAGDVAFTKSEAEFGGAYPIPLPGRDAKSTGISIGAGFRTGMLCPLALGYDIRDKPQPSRINDRFQLGGPTDVRGFTLGGLGPRDGSDAVGGDLFAAGSVNMLLPLPRAGPTSSLRLQLFANGGRLVALQGQGQGQEKPPQGTMSSMASALGELANGLPSTAAGFGLVYAHPVARFEVNFSLPLVVRRGEEGRKGLQVGVGINFL